MNDHRQDNGYTKVYQDDGSCVLLPLADYADVIRAIESAPNKGPYASWEGTTLGGGAVWLKLLSVTAVLECTPEMVETERTLEVTNG